MFPNFDTKCILLAYRAGSPGYNSTKYSEYYYIDVLYCLIRN